MAYWLAISNRDNWNVIRDNNLFAVTKRDVNKINKLNLGDKILIYLSQQRLETQEVLPPVISGAYEVISDAFEDDKVKFLAPPRLVDESFPLRVKLKPLHIMAKPLEFKPLINDLEFITNKKNWASHLQGRSIREIPEADYLLINKRMK